MNNGHRKKIVIASILKPVGDPRLFEKFAQTLAKSGKYNIFIVGYEGSYMNIYPNIRFKPLFKFYRISLSRVFAPFKFFMYVLKVYPELIIIQTHELIWAAVLFKKLTGAKLIYDIQENYYLNHFYSNSYLLPIKYFNALYIRLKELLTWESFNHIIFAEKCYVDEMKFIKKNFTVIENKFKQQKVLESKRSNKNLDAKRILFSGTLSKYSGVYHAIELVRKLHHRDPSYYLVIVGYAPESSVRKRIKYITKRKKYIKLIWDDQPVNHLEILREIEKSDFGLIAYEPNKISKDRIPTKLFEYIGMQLPIICWKNENWDAYLQKYNAGISIDYKNINADQLIEDLNKSEFYNIQYSKEEVLWESEENKLLEIVKNLI
ncbi:MAG: glycosyltransferase [Bacteroidota bacterium]|nr:glycosyltransferase [Bacteroidota bacterium]